MHLSLNAPGTSAGPPNDATIVRKARPGPIRGMAPGDEPRDSNLARDRSSQTAGPPLSAPFGTAFVYKPSLQESGISRSGWAKGMELQW